VDVGLEPRTNEKRVKVLGQGPESWEDFKLWRYLSLNVFLFEVLIGG